MTDPELVVELLRAVRVWRSSLIPSTSTGLSGPTASLIRAIEAIDACTHPREQHVFVPGRGEGIPPGTLCGKCGAALP